ncbi:MAG: RNA-directed DNA polymerase, partial [Deltaproteobacteria bacterium]|nr:RNA-directed DNA polymerase [Deltaproteobacteria bacterium]
MKEKLFPTLEDVKLECVLVQAWKKSSAYIRYHNWYADTLGLDYQSLRLPQFIKELQEKLEDSWKTTPLKVVPAPKSQKWAIGDDNNWKQKQGEDISNKLRPLAHVSFEDQIVSSAIMLCLANHVETLQGNPETDITRTENRKKVINYGNRLFCDYSDDGAAQHRWGSSTLYRKYFTDYQTFLRRPEIVAKEIRSSFSVGYEVAIVHCDLSKFYDRVRPDNLHDKIRRHAPQEIQDDLLNLAKSVFNWTWHDSEWADNYAKKNEIDDFGTIALPQGLVSSGFFANIFLIDFDEALKSSFTQTIKNNISLIDACRYVDDLRLVLAVPKDAEEKVVKDNVTNWLQAKLD